MNIVDLENKGVYITWDNITTTDENIPCKHNSYENQIFIAFFFYSLPKQYIFFPLTVWIISLNSIKFTVWKA